MVLDFPAAYHNKSNIDYYNVKEPIISWKPENYPKSIHLNSLGCIYIEYGFRNLLSDSICI